MSNPIFFSTALLFCCSLLLEFYTVRVHVILQMDIVYSEGIVSIRFVALYSNSAKRGVVTILTVVITPLSILVGGRGHINI